MKCCHKKRADPPAWLCGNRFLTFSNSPSASELIWLYKCSQLPRDLDTGTRDISISLTDVILITLNFLTLCCGFTCFFILLWRQGVVLGRLFCCTNSLIYRGLSFLAKQMLSSGNHLQFNYFNFLKWRWGQRRCGKLIIPTTIFCHNYFQIMWISYFLCRLKKVVISNQHHCET